MSKEQFEAMLEAKASASKTQGEKKIDWEARKQEWLVALEGFYNQLENWLLEYSKAGKIALEKKHVVLQEDYLGQYQADGMILRIGSEQVELRPIGTLLIGARGRVDMEGPKGTVKFILTGKNSNGIRISVTFHTEGSKKTHASEANSQDEEWVWKIATAPPQIRFIELTPETFFDAITEVLNG